MFGLSFLVCPFGSGCRLRAVGSRGRNVTTTLQHFPANDSVIPRSTIERKAVFSELRPIFPRVLCSRNSPFTRSEIARGHNYELIGIAAPGGRDEFS